MDSFPHSREDAPPNYNLSKLADMDMVTVKGNDQSREGTLEIVGSSTGLYMNIAKLQKESQDLDHYIRVDTYDRKEAEPIEEDQEEESQD